MKLLYILLFVSAFQISFAQEENNQEVVFPQFEDCNQDDETEQSCFENTFTSKFKDFYKQTEIAKDYNYVRVVIGNYVVNRRGIIEQEGYNSTESPIFVAIKRAVDEMAKMSPSTNEKDRPVDFNFQVKFSLKRANAYKDDALSVEVEFIYPEAEKENS